ncbi:hypothetical protein B0T16DRAFT_449695 [Cercophora newfieldiana]|uniref:Secreted protein n=1 Tax=Cercophora newfieldiana TaxID=92897 RepID=A0AA39XS87_9PEZI|nr:hypothetical protein B0T16DRAFT_449695 [Cercophora newfieldiana]
MGRKLHVLCLTASWVSAASDLALGPGIFVHVGELVSMSVQIPGSSKRRVSNALGTAGAKNRKHRAGVDEFEYSSQEHSKFPSQLSNPVPVDGSSLAIKVVGAIKQGLKPTHNLPLEAGHKATSESAVVAGAEKETIVSLQVIHTGQVQHLGSACRFRPFRPDQREKRQIMSTWEGFTPPTHTTTPPFGLVLPPR